MSSGLNPVESALNVDPGDSAGALSAATALPLSLGPLDHYTLIVEDAAAVARFHVEALGFEALRVQLVNAGSAPEGEHDMLNHVLQLPGAPGRVCVVTQGLRDESVFSRYVARFGPGLHHVGYQVADLESALQALLSVGIEMTSREPLRDPLSGLRQIFIARQHCGYFVELVEHTAEARAGMFTNHDRAALARTMIGYLQTDDGDDSDNRTQRPDPTVQIARAHADVLAFLCDPLALGRWTAHRNIRPIDGRFVEVRMAGDVELHIEPSADQQQVLFHWRRAQQALSFAFAVTARDARSTTVTALLPELPADRVARTHAVLDAELRVLRALLEDDADAVDARDRALIERYHLEVYQRAGL